MARPWAMKRDELEAQVWRNFRHTGDAEADAAAVDAILAAADLYAQRGSYAAVAMHYEIPCRVEDEGHQCVRPPRACNTSCVSADIVPGTTVVGDVTCAKCKSSTPWLEALGQEMAA